MRNKYGTIYKVANTFLRIKEYVAAKDEEEAFEKVCKKLNQPLKLEEMKIDVQEWNTKKGDIVKVYWNSSSKELRSCEGHYFYGIVVSETLMLAKVKPLQRDFDRVDLYLEREFVEITGDFRTKDVMKVRKMILNDE